MKTTLTRYALALLFTPCLAGALHGQTSTTGRLEGVIIDSLHAAPLVDALVTAVRLDVDSAQPLIVRTDKVGHYLFDKAPAGRYAVNFESPLLDSLEFGDTRTTTLVRAQETIRADLAIPSSETLRGLACPGSGLARNNGALLGVISNAQSHEPLADATLSVTWRELGIDSVTREIGQRPRTVRAKTNASGQYRLCGIPTNENLDVAVEHQGASGPLRPVFVDDDVGVLVRNVALRVRPAEDVGASTVVQPIVVERTASGRARLAGKITRPDGKPLAGAQLRVTNTAVAGRSDDEGNFLLAGLPGGTQQLEVMHLGYDVVRRPVELRDDQTTRQNVDMTRVVSLDSVRVVAHRITLPEFERNRLQYHRGKFMDADDIAKNGRRTLPLILTSTGDFRMLPGPRGSLSVQSLHLRACTQTAAGTERLDQLNLVVDNMEHMEMSDVFFPIVEAIEIYPNGDNAPVKYGRACSVVVVWTQRSEKHPKAERDISREP